MKDDAVCPDEAARPVIRIDPEVWNLLAAQCRPGESLNQVLRRLFRLGPSRRGRPKKT